MRIHGKAFWQGGRQSWGSDVVRDSECLVSTATSSSGPQICWPCHRWVTPWRAELSPSCEYLFREAFYWGEGLQRNHFANPTKTTFLNESSHSAAPPSAPAVGVIDYLGWSLWFRLCMYKVENELSYSDWNWLIVQQWSRYTPQTFTFCAKLKFVFWEAFFTYDCSISTAALLHGFYTPRLRTSAYTFHQIHLFASECLGMYFYKLNRMH